MADLTQRAATINDMKGIWSLVREAAADSSVDLTTDAGQESALTEIMIGCSSELSPVTVAKDKTIVGAVLARRDELEWGLANANIIHVTFAAVAPSHKDQGVLQAMLSGLQAKKLPIHVSVKAGSKNGLTDALKGLGFEVATAAADGEVFVWDPPAAANGAAAAA